MYVKRLACLALLTALTIVGVLYVGAVHATDVSGTIKSNTTWTHANYIKFVGNVVVPSGVTLTIEPEATIDFNTYTLQVDGTLVAKGAVDDIIVFTSSGVSASARTQAVDFMADCAGWSDSSGSGSIMQYVAFNTILLTVEGSSPKICNCTFQTSMQAITINGGSPQIVGDAVSTTGAALGAVGTPTITGNVFESSASSPSNFLVTLGGNANFHDNDVYGGWVGVQVNDSPVIDGNTVTGSYIGLFVSTSEATIQHNYIAENHYGIGSGGSNIDYNTIIKNAVGIDNPAASCLIDYNNIYGNTQYNIQMNAGVNVNAANNWWGTTDTQAINQTIYDHKNDSTLGTVQFVPFLLDASIAAPSAPGITVITTTQPSSSPQPTEAPANPTANPLSPTQTPQNPQLGQMSKSGGFDVATVETFVLVVVLPLLLAVLIIVVIRKSTSTSKRTATRRNRKK